MAQLLLHLGSPTRAAAAVDGEVSADAEEVIAGAGATDDEEVLADEDEVIAGAEGVVAVIQVDPENQPCSHRLQNLVHHKVVMAPKVGQVARRLLLIAEIQR